MTDTMPAGLAANLIIFCENRRRVYALLSRCFETEIDAAFADKLARETALESDDPALVEGFAALKADLADADEGALEQLAVAFNRVFFGMGPRTAQKAFPYESVYTSEDGLMMQEAYVQVKRVYAAAGFAKDPSFTEPERPSGGAAGVHVSLVRDGCRSLTGKRCRSWPRPRCAAS